MSRFLSQLLGFSSESGVCSPPPVSRVATRRLCVVLTALALVGPIPGAASTAAPVDGRNWDHKFVGGHEGRSTGDVNGDGIDDVLINNSQVVWIVFGEAGTRRVNLTDLGARGFTINPPTKGSFLTAPLGDVNGDGLGDVGIAAYQAAVRDRGKPGVVYVVFGKADTQSVALSEFNGADPRGFRILGPIDFALTGYNALEPAGDVNADGLADIVVGAPFNSTTYVVFGQEEFTDIDLRDFDLDVQLFKGYRIETPSPAYASDYEVTEGGDLSGDGLPDVVISVRQERGPIAIYVVYGKADPVPLDVREQGTWGYRIRPGDGVSGMGGASLIDDLNRDGKAELIIPCCFRDRIGAGPTGKGPRNVVVYGRASVTDRQLSELIDEGFQIFWPSRSFLGEVSTLPRGNGDNWPDLLIGSPYQGRDQEGEGVVYVLFGRADPHNIHVDTLKAGGYRIDGNRRNLFFGETVDAISDMDGDGRNEILVSTQGFDGPKQAFLFQSDS